MKEAKEQLNAMLDKIFKYGRHKPRIKSKTKAKKKKGS